MDEEVFWDDDASFKYGISWDPQEISQEANAYFDQGNVLYEQGSKEQALEYYDKAININPQHGQAFYNKSVALQDLGQKQEALICLDQTIKLNPSNSQAYANKGNLLSALQREEEAIYNYDLGLQINPSDAQIYNNKGSIIKNNILTIGNVLSVLKSQEEAIKCYDIGIQIDKNQILAFVNRGALKFRQFQFEDALKDLKKAQQLMDNEKNQINYSSGNLEFIKGVLKKIIEIEWKLDYQKDYLKLMDPNSDDESVKKMSENLEKFNEEKGEIYIKQFENIQSANEKFNEKKGEIYIKQPENIQSANEQLNQLYEQVQKQQKQIEEHNQRFQEHNQRLVHLEKVIKDAGINQLAEIRRNFREASSSCQNYSKVFYWTTLNYFELLKTTNNQNNNEKKQNNNTSPAITIALYLLDLGSKLPCFKKLFQLINDEMSNKLKLKKDTKIIEDALLDIYHKIQNNEQNWSLDLASTAQEQAIEQNNKLGKKEIELQTQLDTRDDIFNKMDKMLNDEDQAQFYDTREGLSAVKDVIELLVYMTQNRNKIMKDPKPINIIISTFNDKREQSKQIELNQQQKIEQDKLPGQQFQQKLFVGQNSQSEQIKQATTNHQWKIDAKQTIELQSQQKQNICQEQKSQQIEQKTTISDQFEIYQVYSQCSLFSYFI